ncbi:hypothetical protein PJ311_16190 [Bacillus sp. CLL-7-23]|uniref:Uncharacterized protein n=1 Tax=Bacillus changyiensis TaxID=3004103 RepID=A0ABT4X742_9BACI|nr:hypothetical protein [Bacillus changyiensis]MDA1476189.1 hypothetical protein [Bacillus changyiensis]MDA7028115.1 hypothetical protein [Bacillus changyiensis]
MNDDTFEIIQDELINSETEEKVIGIRIMIKGGFKKKLDSQKSATSTYANEVGRMVTNGITKIIKEIK